MQLLECNRYEVDSNRTDGTGGWKYVEASLDVTTDQVARINQYLGSHPQSIQSISESKVDCYRRRKLFSNLRKVFSP
jgi:hypothetical protein